MIRLIGILIGLGFTVVVLWAFGWGAYTQITEPPAATAEHEFHLEPKALHLASDGPFGKWDVQQLQRGYQVYKEVCAACHSLKFVAMRDLAQLTYSEAEVKAEAASWTVPGIDATTGEVNTRPGTPTDYFPSPFANDIAAATANGGKIPPDLSLMVKAREGGAAYIYSLLTGYREQAGYKNEEGHELLREFPDAKTPSGGYFNPYFSALNIGMPPPLADGRVTYADGTQASVDQMAKDVSAFLTWTAEPTLVKRRQTGWAVLAFLLFATVLGWLAKKQVWAPIVPKRRKD
jgi:ubiquinol-cytochrome c reductase cytochrome c1 subunit